MSIAPLKSFADERNAIDNLLFTSYNGMPFMVGQKVYGTWVDSEGRTYGPLYGHIVYYEATGYWVESENGITPVKLFWVLNFYPPTVDEMFE